MKARKKDRKIDGKQERNHESKKSICYLLTFLLSCFLLKTSCVYYTENLFDKSAEERMTEALKTYRQLLTAQTNGWIVEYFPEKTRKYGGFNLYFRFEGDNVTIRSEIDPAVSATSAWSTGTDMGPTINFDIYNAVLHYFSDPGVPQGGGYGLNYEGDYEFVVISGSATEFVLMGKKTKNIIHMKPLPAGISADAYFQAIDEMDQNVIAPAYKMTVGSKEISIVRKGRTKVFALKINENDKETISAPFIVTTDGIKFYEPLTIDGKTLHVFTYQAAGDKIISDKGNAEISVVIVPLSTYFSDGLSFNDWYFKTENIGPGYLTAWNTAKNNLLNKQFKLAYAWLGALGDDTPAGVSIGVWDDETRVVYVGTYAYDFEIVSNDRIKFNYNQAKTNAGGNVASYFSSAVSGFTINAFNGRTFTLVPDRDIITNPKNVVRIDEITLVDVTNPNNWVKVGLEEVLWP